MGSCYRTVTSGLKKSRAREVSNHMTYNALPFFKRADIGQGSGRFGVNYWSSLDELKLKYHNNIDNSNVSPTLNCVLHLGTGLFRMSISLWHYQSRRLKIYEIPNSQSSSCKLLTSHQL